MEKKIKELILSGSTLNDIYLDLSVSKTMINSVFKSIDYRILFDCDWNYLRIKMEKALFSLHRKYKYVRNKALADLPNCFDYIVYEENEVKLAINILDFKHLTSNGLPIFDKKEYFDSFYVISENERICKKKEIPFLKITILEIIDWPFLVDELRRSLNERDYAETHNKWAEEEYSNLSDLWMCAHENYHHVRASKKCGCYSCGSIFDSQEAILFGQDSSMACPYCKEATLICDFQGFNISSVCMKTIKDFYQDPDD